MVWRAAENQGYPYGTIVQLLIATGQRRGEIANLRWPWINEKEQTITLPDWLTKNHKEHVFPYNGIVAEILATIPRRNSTNLLFPAANSDERPLSGWSKYKKQLKDGVAPWRLHDLRRTYRTTHAQLGTPREIGERLINHAAGVATDVELVYDTWTYLPPMREAAQKFETYLRTLLAPLSSSNESSSSFGAASVPSV
jgi:integrase